MSPLITVGTSLMANKEKRLTARFRRATDGATAVEYSVLAGLIGLALAATLSSLGQKLDDPINCANETIVQQQRAASCN